MKVSVCIPTYNQAQYVEQAIRSAVNQTIPPFEIIVFDDCSTDGTKDVLLKLIEELSLLKVKFQTSNLGIPRNTDECLRAAQGDFIVRLDSDDLLKNVFIEKLGHMLSEYPAAGYGHAAVQQIDQHSNPTFQRKLFRKTGFQEGSKSLKASIKGYKVAANIIMFRKKALQEVDYLTGRPNFCEDFHLSVSLASKGFGNIYLSEILSCYRVWTDVKNIRSKRKIMEIEGFSKVFSEVLEPAFKERKWNLKMLNRHKLALACKQTDCLGWNFYTQEEKHELAKALVNLSPSIWTRLFIKLRIMGYTRILDPIYTVTNRLRLIIKKALLNLNSDPRK
ncbi:MAG: glycosyltransferase [Bacteroidota bacterium]|nr:glycosyltransferase [Bacteroidota bacterium]